MDRRQSIKRWLALREREGLTYRELSERSGVPASTLAGWAWRLRRERDGQRELEFVELGLASSNELESPGGLVELFLRGERRLVFSAGADAEAIARLATALERC